MKEELHDLCGVTSPEARKCMKEGKMAPSTVAATRQALCQSHNNHFQITRRTLNAFFN
jgi:hypothetical protein